jgi:hypothetical protein
MLGVAQPGVGPQRAQQRLLQDVLGLTVPGEPPRVGEQLVAVELHERPERGQGDSGHGGATRGGARL